MLGKICTVCMLVVVSACLVRPQPTSKDKYSRVFNKVKEIFSNCRPKPSAQAKNNICLIETDRESLVKLLKSSSDGEEALEALQHPVTSKLTELDKKKKKYDLSLPEANDRHTQVENMNTIILKINEDAAIYRKISLDLTQHHNYSVPRITYPASQVLEMGKVKGLESLKHISFDGSADEIAEANSLTRIYETPLLLNEGDIIAAKRIFSEAETYLKKREDLLVEVQETLNKDEGRLKKLEKDISTEDELNEGMALTESIDKNKQLEENAKTTIAKLKEGLREAETKISDAGNDARTFIAGILGQSVGKVNFPNNIHETLLFRKDFIDIDGAVPIETHGRREIIKIAKERIKKNNPLKKFMRDVITNNLSISDIKGKFNKYRRGFPDDDDFNIGYGYGHGQKESISLSVSDADRFKMVSDPTVSYNSEPIKYKDTWWKVNPDTVINPQDYSYIVAEVKAGEMRAYVCITNSKIIFHSIQVYTQTNKSKAQTRDIRMVNAFCQGQT